MLEFSPFRKIPRLFRECVISEKIDGTNASITITPEGELLVASRNGWITPDKDNYGFAKWATEHKEELMTLGEGIHFGEWWGSGCQRGYGLVKGEKRFSLFNTSRWLLSPPPACCHVVPILFQGEFSTEAVVHCLDALRAKGSRASPGFMKPEGVVCFHTASQSYFKATLEKDQEHKSTS